MWGVFIVKILYNNNVRLLFIELNKRWGYLMEGNLIKILKCSFVI